MKTCIYKQYQIRPAQILCQLVNEPVFVVDLHVYCLHWHRENASKGMSRCLVCGISSTHFESDLLFSYKNVPFFRTRFLIVTMLLPVSCYCSPSTTGHEISPSIHGISRSFWHPILVLPHLQYGLRNNYTT